MSLFRSSLLKYTSTRSRNCSRKPLLFTTGWGTTAKTLAPSSTSNSMALDWPSSPGRASSSWPSGVPSMSRNAVGPSPGITRRYLPCSRSLETRNTTSCIVSFRPMYPGVNVISSVGCISSGRYEFGLISAIFLLVSPDINSTFISLLA